MRKPKGKTKRAQVDGLGPAGSGGRTRAKDKETIRISITPDTAVLAKARQDRAAAESAPTVKWLRSNQPEVLRVEGGEKYRMGPVLAEGGMGLVREAEDLRCLRTVALKRLLKGEKISDEDRERFISEAQITSRLEHPNIMPIHELGFDINRNVYYTMKYIHGRTLTDILMDIRRENEEVIEQYPLSRLLNIFQKVCDATAFAHSKGIMHCDLKPDNIMVCDFGEVVLTDWGLARYVDETPAGHGILKDLEEAAERLEGEAAARAAAGEEPFSAPLRADTVGAVTRTSTGAIMGTPGFMAPERVLDDATIDMRSDVYSLGATLYSVITLRAPIAGADMNEMLRKILRGDIVPPVGYNHPETLPEQNRPSKPPVFPHCPEGVIPEPLSKIAMRALATDPDERYASVQELQEDVEAYQNGLIWHTVLDDDFSDPDVASRWQLVGGSWELKDGELRVYGGEPQLLILKKDVPGDVRIEYECRQESPYLNDMSCFMAARRSKSSKEIAYSGYEFKFGGYDNSMNLLVRGDRRLWSEVASPIERGKRYRIRAERVGSRLRLVVNNKEILRVHDADPLTGGDRTAIGLFGWIADTRFSRITVSCLGAPWKSDVLDLADRQAQKGSYEMAEALYREAMESFPDTARAERARRGLESVHRCKELNVQLPVIRAELEKAWPDSTIHLGMDNDGFTLDIADGEIESLEPLRGLPLRTLYCQNNRIRSLEPLRGMSLVTLNCGGNPVGSLEPLRGMSLTTLICEHCDVDSFEPLRGMPLAMLIAGGNPVRTLDPLRGMPMTNLSVWGCEIEDLEPLKGMPLSVLYCNTNRVRTLDPLRGMMLVMLNCSGNEIDSLEPLRGAPLKVLHFGLNHVSSLAPLRGMKLNMATFTGNRVSSLEPLRGMPMGVLTCANNRLATLEPFVESPPEDFLFDCDTIPSEELQRALNVWSRKPALAHLVRNTEVLLALRRDGLKGLRPLAKEFEGRLYLFVPKFLRWEDAEVLCEQAGGHLVTIRTPNEQGFLESLFVTGCWAWMGIEVTEEGTRWITGEPMTYQNFMDVLQARKPGRKVFAGRWQSEDVPWSENSFIIEWDNA